MPDGVNTVVSLNTFLTGVENPLQIGLTAFLAGKTPRTLMVQTPTSFHDA